MHNIVCIAAEIEYYAAEKHVLISVVSWFRYGMVCIHGRGKSKMQLAKSYA